MKFQLCHPGARPPTVSFRVIPRPPGPPSSRTSWPAPRNGCGGAAPCNPPGSPFAGFYLKTGAGQELVYFWVQPPRTPGDYYVAGLRVTYRIGSATYTGDLFSGGEMCVREDWLTVPVSKACNGFSNKADAALTNMVDHGS